MHRWKETEYKQVNKIITDFKVGVMKGMYRVIKATREVRMWGRGVSLNREFGSVGAGT